LKINNAIKIAAMETDSVIKLDIKEVKAMIKDLTGPMENKVKNMIAENEAMARQNENFVKLYRQCLSQ